MEVNKEQAERCLELGAQALNNGDYERAVKMLQKSRQLYHLKDVDVLLAHAMKMLEKKNNGSSNSHATENASSSRSSERNSATNTNGSRATETSSSNGRGVTPTESRTGADGRTYTEEQVQIVKEVLRAKEGGRGAHYRVLNLNQNCTESDIKKAYRKLSLKVHPDKNSAPHADEAFKAVGLAYATLSDPQKRTIYDRYGEEDPDNHGGRAAGPGGMHMRPGQEVSPEEIFNMFFGGGMPGMHRAGPGFHVYTTGFGPGMQNRWAGPNPRQQQQQRQQRAQNQEQAPFAGMLFQMLPLLLIMMVSFLRFDEKGPTVGNMPGEGQYFSMTRKPPFVNPMKTQATAVRDIPFYVTDNFLRTYSRNRSQMGRVERMVELAYEQYLVEECTKQHNYKNRLETIAGKENDPLERKQKLKSAQEFELTRCQELSELYPHRKVKL